jgi:hypothetical protein
MRIIEEKKTICTTIKVLYDKGKYYHSDIRAKAKEGFKVVTVSNYHLGCPEVVTETTADGTILTYVKNEELK